MDQIAETVLPPPAPDHADSAARFDIASRLFLRLYQDSNLLHKTGTRALGRYGATTQQWAVLDRLEAAHLVERVRDTRDGRFRHVRLTAQGERTWSEMQVSIRAYYADALSDFSSAECLQLFRLLDRLRDGLTRLSGPE